MELNFHKFCRSSDLKDEFCTSNVLVLSELIFVQLQKNCGKTCFNLQKEGMY